MAADESYDHVQVNRWVPVGKAHVFYTSNLSMRNLRRRVLEISPNIIYLNSFFSMMTIRTLLLRRLGWLPASPMVLSPRGSFNPGSLHVKRFRKSLFRKVMIPAGLYRNLIWQASSALEKQELSAAGVFSKRDDGKILVSPDVPSPNVFEPPLLSSRPEKQSGTARFVFYSRISRNKNLHVALEMLTAVRGEVEVQIVGPMDDAAYWGECQERILALPRNVVVNYKGPIPCDDVNRMFQQHHFLFLPTAGENFGYAILEAFASGCPVLISDRTPWRDLSAQSAGWDIPLENRQQWQQVIQECVDMNPKAYQTLSHGSRRFAEDWLSSTAYRETAQDLFRCALEHNAGIKRS